MKLRDYQTDLINRARTAMAKGIKRILIVSPCGSGKTALTAAMLGTASSKGMGCWFIVHRRELVKQSILAFDRAGVNHGVVASGFPHDYSKRVQIASVQTLKNRMHLLKKPTLIVYDEAHHCAAGTWAAIHAANPQAFHVGITATPQRLDGKGLRPFFDEMILGPSVRWLIENGFLADYRMFSIPGPDTSRLHIRMGDYAKGEAEALMDRPTITGDAVKHYLRLAKGKRAVVFCTSIKHSESIVAAFKSAGIPAEHVDGESDRDYRDSALKRFEMGETLVLSNVDLFGEGFDLPSIEVSILMRPTKSLGLYIQQVGRALRPSPGKTEALIIDHAGTIREHGAPCEDREWSLDGSGVKKKTESSGPSVRTCPKCFAAQFSRIPACGFCGHVYEIEARREVEQVDGDLVEIDRLAARRQARQEQGQSQSEDALYRLALSRGYKNPRGWAKHVFQARQLKKLKAGRRV